MTPPRKLPGHEGRVRTAWIFGTLIGIAFTVLLYFFMFSGAVVELRKANETGRMWLILGFCGIVVGSSAIAFIARRLHLRAEREDDARIPSAKLVDRS